MINFRLFISPLCLYIFFFAIINLFNISCKKVKPKTNLNNDTVQGKYAGLRNIQNKGNDPIGGEFTKDTSYLNTIEVWLNNDSIYFIKGNFQQAYLKNDSDLYRNYMSYYKIINADTLTDYSYLYTGTDAFHYRSTTSVFTGIKQ
jgi:hypothetical protein